MGQDLELPICRMLDQSARAVNPAVSSITVFFPCFNDAATIATMVRAAIGTLERLGVEGEVIVINDGSTDNSAHVLEDLRKLEPLLRIVTHEHNRGYGGALLSGFAEATQQWIFYTDGDAQYDPTELALLVEAASDAIDVVQGYKLRRADGLVRTTIGCVYHRAVRRAFSLRIRDTDCDFRLIRRSKLDEIQLAHTTGVICVELVRKLQDSDARFVEVGVSHYKRPYGRSEFFRVGAVARTLRALAVLWLQERRRPRSRNQVPTTTFPNRHP